MDHGRYLVNDMDDSALKDKLQACKNVLPQRNLFTIGHRGACMQFAEHSNQSYHAAFRMGAGMIECDVVFTKDTELVCRHSQCDLHTSTDILVTPLAAACSIPFKPAEYNAAGELVAEATAFCCTSDITLDQFKTLRAKMDGYWPYARTPQEYTSGYGVPDWRTTLYSAAGHVMSHREYIHLMKSFGVKMIPELKKPVVKMPFGGFSTRDLEQKIIDQYIEAQVPPEDVFLQSFERENIDFWNTYDRRYGKRAVFLQDNIDDFRDPHNWPNFTEIYLSGINFISPPMWMLTDVIQGHMAMSDYALAIKRTPLQIITWTFERSGSLYINGGGGYYQSLNGENQAPHYPQPSVIDNDGDEYQVMDLLAQQVGVVGLFSDWSATVNYYSNCVPVRNITVP
jgi:glycerophosphoryl diester phosphodiesterase